VKIKVHDYINFQWYCQDFLSDYIIDLLETNNAKKQRAVYTAAHQLLEVSVVTGSSITRILVSTRGG